MGKLTAFVALAFLLAACSSGSQTETGLYCYKTLARVDCHATPQEGQEGRLVGSYDEALY